MLGCGALERGSRATMAGGVVVLMNIVYLEDEVCHIFGDSSSDLAGVELRRRIAPTLGIRTRPSMAAGCPAGYRNRDTGGCVTPASVYFLEGRGFPNQATVGRNTVFTGGVNNWDATLFKTFRIRERTKLEFRWEAFNHPQVPAPRDVFTTLPEQFLNRDYTDSGIRSMRVQVKLIF